MIILNLNGFAGRATRLLLRRHNQCAGCARSLSFVTSQWRRFSVRSVIFSQYSLFIPTISISVMPKM